jgi:hypothetical protein
LNESANRSQDAYHDTAADDQTKDLASVLD